MPGAAKRISLLFPSLYCKSFSSSLLDRLQQKLCKATKTWGLDDAIFAFICVGRLRICGFYFLDFSTLRLLWAHFSSAFGSSTTASNMVIVSSPQPSAGRDLIDDRVRACSPFKRWCSGFSLHMRIIMSCLLLSLIKFQLLDRPVTVEEFCSSMRLVSVEV